MRKKPLEASIISVYKDASALIAAKLDKEIEDRAKWEDLVALSASMGLRHPSPWFKRQVTRRIASEVSVCQRALKKLSKVLRCGARTRKGTPCQCKPLPGKRRCRLHGGKSTGPKTEAGREAIRESNRRRAKDRSRRPANEL